MMARVDRLDLVLGYLEEMMTQQHHHHGDGSSWSPSAASSSSSAGTGTPRGSKTWRRRPAKEALEEAQTKGTLVDRIAFLEDRVLKMEEDMVTPENTKMTRKTSSSKKRNKQGGLKSLVKSCVRGKLKTKE
ncbi:hypothetical protein HU200_008943 [Digitaria exilis]|uniref:Uncharacterized protein n=1 Tax=Digitaria exilis TaxID=1010633 RepID=A0A835FL15_9POAL|nr:hypothetical protein HU200_008943 [Digitaria exilis]CAB3466644.1 unnamed protein product [Digitaria exilis]